MKSEFPADKVAAATRTLRARMANAACLHLDKIGARDVVALEQAGILKRGASVGGLEPIVVELLNSHEHPLRVKGAAGPFLFYKSEGLQNQQYALDVTEVVLSSDRVSRTAALDHFELLATVTEHRLSPPTAKALHRKREEILSSDDDKWQRAALELYDLLRDDLLLQLAGVEQSLEGHFDAGIKEYFPRVLRPTLHSLEALDLRFVKPSEQQAQLTDLIAECVQMRTLVEACNHYIHSAGYLPLAPQFGLGRAVKEWSAQHSQTEAPNVELWNWAACVGGALVRYHVCMAILSNSEWIDQGDTKLLWEEIVEIIASQSASSADLVWRSEWSLRRELAQHFIHFLECRAPNALGEPIACSAWWLSDRIACLVAKAPDVIASLRHAAILPEAKSSFLAWQLAAPRAVRSAFETVTVLDASPWALSLLQQVKQEELTALSPSPDDATLSIFEQGLAASVFFGPALPLSTGEHTTYGFELGLTRTVTAWSDYMNRSGGSELATTMPSLCEKLSNLNEFTEALSRIQQEDEASQMLIGTWAKTLAVQGSLPRAGVWKLLSDVSWRNEALTSIADNALESLFVAFTVGFEPIDEDWTAHLTHVYATACEAALAGSERRRVLFWFTACSGLHTYSVSGLQRLLSGSERSSYLEMLPELRTWLQMSRNAPPWLVGRIRAILSAVSVAGLSLSV